MTAERHRQVAERDSGPRTARSARAPAPGIAGHPPTGAPGLPVSCGGAAAEMLRLQRTIGNRSLTGLLERPPASGVLLPVIQRDYERPGKDGGIYESERFGPEGSKRERPTVVELPVRSVTTMGRGAAPAPLSQFAHGGKLDVAGTARKAGFDGGHVVGLHIGGEDISENVVPMWKAFNRGAYKKMEDDVKGRAKTIVEGGQKAWITITCYYADGEADTPYAFDVLLESSPPNRDARTAVWATFLRQPEDIKLVAPLSDDEQKVVRGEVDADAIRGLAGAAFESSAKFFALAKGQSVSQYIAAHKTMPSTTNGMYPDHKNLRPYEFLDMLAFSGKLDAGTEMSAFREFTGRQRELILQANMARNGGAIKSDDPQDSVAGGILSEQGDLNFPEIDHVVPKSKGGSNMFSNARVVSWQLNNQEDRVKSLFGVIDLTKRALPPLQGMGQNDIPVLVEHYLNRKKPTGPFSASDVWVWGTETFPVMGGQKGTTARLARVKTALVKYVVANLLVPTPGGFQIKT